MTVDELVSRIAEYCNDGVVIAEADPERSFARKIVWINDAVCAQTGFERADILGQPPKFFRISKADDTEFRRFQAGLDARAPFTCEIWLIRKDGAGYLCEMSLSPVFGSDQTLKHWVFFMRDISERVELAEDLALAQAEASQAEARLRGAIDAMPEPFAIYDADDELVLFNEPFRKGYEQTGARLELGANFEDLMRNALDHGMFPETGPSADDWLAERLEKRSRADCPFVQPIADGRFFKVYDIRTRNGDTASFRVDVTENIRREAALHEKTEALSRTLEELEHASMTDALTELGNRRGLDLAIDKLLAADPAAQAAFLHIDLDRFKPINDVFGHGAGDFLLQVVADILRTSIRARDYVARVGGDEFAILLRGEADGDILREAKSVAQRVIEACNRPVNWQDNRLHFGTSIGIATGEIGTLQTLMTDADIALYKAKDSGRNRFAIFTPRLRKAVEQKKRLADELLVGLSRGEIKAYFQPQVDASSFAPVGAEALVRWEHPERGVLSPAEFLPVIEDLGLSAEVDHLVFEDALRAAQATARAGVLIDKMSVNVSYGRLASLADLEPLYALRPWPCRLSFELLEAIDFDEEPSVLGWTLDGLRDLGIGIEIDDFGSGRASLTTLLNVRPDRIKIDRQIVSEAMADGVDGAAGAMVRAIGELARGLGIAMTAEGVETRDQARTMREMGCDVLQGFYFGKPMPESTLVAWLLERSDQSASA